MITITVIIGISALLIGIVMGYWFAYFTKISDLLNQKAQLKGKCEALEELVDYYENRGETLKIIKEKRVDVYKLFTCFEEGGLERYNSYMDMLYLPECYLTQEEFNLLKEVLL